MREGESKIEENEREISPEIVEGVENCALHTEGKVNFLLVKGGVKPAASIGLVLRNGENQFVSDDDLKSLKSLLEKSGMVYSVGDKSVSETENGCRFEEVEIIVCQTKAELDKILKIKSRMSISQQIEDKNYDKEKERQAQIDFGLAMGYPLTAVQAFTAESEFLTEDFLSEEIKQSDAYLFCQYQLSKNNWQKELQTSQQWADFIRRTSPKIYEQYKKEQTANII